MKKYITPQAISGSEYGLQALLCQSGIADEAGIPDLVEDTYEW